MTKRRSQIWHKQFHIIDVDIFKVHVGLAVNMTEAEVKRRLRKIAARHFAVLVEALRDWDSDPDLQGRTCCVHGGFVVLLRCDRHKARTAIGTLTHEMVHVVQRLLGDRRVPLSGDTDEVHAYLTEFLVRRALELIHN